MLLQKLQQISRRKASLFISTLQSNIGWISILIQYTEKLFNIGRNFFSISNGEGLITHNYVKCLKPVSLFACGQEPKSHINVEEGWSLLSKNIPQKPPCVWSTNLLLWTRMYCTELPTFFAQIRCDNKHNILEWAEDRSALLVDLGVICSRSEKSFWL